MMRYNRLLAVLLPVCGGCVVVNKQIDPTSELAESKVRPGITVLLSDSIHLIRGKRIGLLTNQTGINEKGTSDIDLLREKKAREANVNLVQLFSPEHGLRGTEDRQNIASGVDEKSGLPVYSATRCAGLRSTGHRHANVDLRRRDGVLDACVRAGPQADHSTRSP